MQELEKILEEIEQKKEKCLNVVKMEIDPMEITIHREQYKGLCMAEESIRKHMNDGWISVEERLPEKYISVLVQWEKYDRSIDETLIYLDVMWLEDEEDVVFETINGIPNGRVIAWRPLPEPYRPERSDGK